MRIHSWQHRHNLRYHGTPKYTTFFKKIDLRHFQIDIIQTSPLQKVSEKRLFLRKVMDEKG